MPGQRVSAIEPEQRRLVVRTVGLQGTDHANVVDTFSKLRKDLTNLDAALAEFMKLKRRFEKRAGLALGLQIAARYRLAVILRKHGLGIPGIYLRNSPVEEQVDHMLSFGGKVRRLRRQ